MALKYLDTLWWRYRGLEVSRPGNPNSDVLSDSFGKLDWIHTLQLKPLL